MNSFLHIILFVCICIIAISKDSIANRRDEQTEFSKFVSDKLLEFRGVAPDPIVENSDKDLYLTGPQIEIGGDIFGVNFEGFSKFFDLIVVSTLNLTPNPPYEATGSFNFYHFIPVTITGEYRLTGYLTTSEGTRIPLNGEGSWRIEAEGVTADQHIFWVKSGHVEAYSSYPSFKLNNATINIPGLIPADVPTDLAELLKKKIHEEIWSINRNKIQINTMWLSQANYLKNAFKETPFLDIIGKGIENRAVEGNIQIEAGGKSLNLRGTMWQMDLFLSKAMLRFQQTAAQGLDPLTNLDISLDMSFPSYLKLSGDLNLKFYGIKNILTTSTHSDDRQTYLIIYSDYNGASLTGTHNLTGTITPTNGDVIQIGGGDRPFNLTSFPANSVYRIRYSIGEDRKISLAGNAEAAGMVLRPYNTGYWTINYGGLLDNVRDPYYYDNANSWISQNIETAVANTISRRIEYRILKVLQAAFDLTTFDDIINNPFSL